MIQIDLVKVLASQTRAAAPSSAAPRSPDPALSRLPLPADGVATTADALSLRVLVV